MTARIDIITLGVNELEAAREFYEGGFGASVSAENDALKVSLGPNASCLDLRGWDVVADQAGARAHTSGFRAFTLSYILESADDVDRILNRLERHGGRVSKPPKNAVWGYSAYVTDPSGYLWKIASSKGRPLLGRKQPAANNGAGEGRRRAAGRQRLSRLQHHPYRRCSAARRRAGDSRRSRRR